MNSPDLDSEISISEQITLIKMLRSDDIESVRLALSLIDKYKKPTIAINYSEKLGTGKYPIVASYSFFEYVRIAARYELSFLKPDNWIKENREMLERLTRY
jgi:hypothetical protein